jgi:hypothetical protein
MLVGAALHEDALGKKSSGSVSARNGILWLDGACFGLRVGKCLLW